MAESTVPDFFQEETSAALRCQTDWLARAVGVDDAFFARLVGTDEATWLSWRADGADLPRDGEETLRSLWRTVLHLLSFANFDSLAVRYFFQYTWPARPVGSVPLWPPWGGSSLKTYLAAGGAEAIEKVDAWVTGFRFGDPYAA
jgi:hypothetical protein